MSDECLMEHPLDCDLRVDMIPHIWCSGCGLGIVVNAFIKGLNKAGIPKDKRVIVSGIGCTARASGYIKMDSYHTTHGRAIAFATGVKLAKPELNVSVFSGDGDLFAIGGNHLIHAARRNMDLHVICVNNFNYGMTGGQGGPTTPINAQTKTTPLGSFEHPFNLPYLASACGAVYVARWTIFDARQIINSIAEASRKRGFTFIEVISSCPTGYGRPNKRSALEEIVYYKQHRVFKKEDTKLEDTDIKFKGDIVIGKFIDRDKPTYLDLYNKNIVEKVKEKS